MFGKKLSNYKFRLRRYLVPAAALAGLVALSGCYYSPYGGYYGYPGYGYAPPPVVGGVFVGGGYGYGHYGYGRGYWR